MSIKGINPAGLTDALKALSGRKMIVADLAFAIAGGASLVRAGLLSLRSVIDVLDFDGRSPRVGGDKNLFALNRFPAVHALYGGIL